MSNHELLSVVTNKSAYTINDMMALNAALKKTSAADLLGHTGANLDIVRLHNGKLQFVSPDEISYFNGSNINDVYAEQVDSYGCWNIDASLALAAHLSSGQIVLQFIYEGHEVHFHTIIPGKVRKD